MNNKLKKTGPFRDFFALVRKDLREINFRTLFFRDVRSIYYFYLTPQDREKLAAMGWMRRWLYRILWFAKSIFFKLSVMRRLLLLFSLYLIIDVQNQSRMTAGYALIFIILLLELKDKLLAHDELKAGRVIQEALRPQQCPELCGWDIFLYSESANEVGGDLINCLPIDDDHTGFMVGDVSGKGLGAALLMAQLQASVEALISHIKSLPKLAVQLNQLYCRENLANQFISFIFLQATPKSGKISFVNAGHLPPIVVGRNGLKELGKGGLALGLSHKTNYKEESVTLHSGDLLVVYTDGVTEARNPEGEFYGDTRFLQLLSTPPAPSASSLGQAIVHDVEKFAQNAGRNDDLTLMILKRTE